MQTTETTAKTRAARELSGSSQNNQTARCHRLGGNARTYHHHHHHLFEDRGQAVQIKQYK